MDTRAITAASLTALLSVAGVAGAAAHDPAEPETAGAPERTVTGTVVMAQTEDGRIVYLLDTGDGEPIELHYGPSWFGGELSPLHTLVGSTVTLGGNLRDGLPSENASETAMENAARAPGLKVLIVDDERPSKGKPPWAGGPKAVGDVHPGHEGWSRGHAHKPDKPDRPEWTHRSEQGGDPDTPTSGSRGPLEDA